jgi:hypothetical protein
MEIRCGCVCGVRWSKNARSSLLCYGVLINFFSSSSPPSRSPKQQHIHECRAPKKFMSTQPERFFFLIYDNCLHMMCFQWLWHIQFSIKTFSSPRASWLVVHYCVTFFMFAILSLFFFEVTIIRNVVIEYCSTFSLHFSLQCIECCC